MNEVSEKKIVKSRTMSCSLEDMWNKWTTHGGLLTFFGKDNKVELRPGGVFEIYFLLDNPPGLRGSEGCKVLSYLPQSMLSFSWNAPPDHAEIRNHEHKTWVVVNFRAETDNLTEVEINHIGWLIGEKWDAAYDYFDKAWDTVLDWCYNSCSN